MKTDKTPEKPEKITVVTGSSTYSFTPSWTENESLNGILTGLIADDLNRLKNR